jgi:uncharacterized protein (TIGR02145 family)
MKKILFLLCLFLFGILSCTNRDEEIIELINSVKKQNDDLKLQITSLKKTSDSVIYVINKLNSSQVATDKKLDAIQAEFKSVLSQISFLSLQMTVANADLISINSKLDELKLKCAELLSTLINLTSPNFSTVISKTGRIWIDRNLGALQVASSSSDEKAFGNLYQWGRKEDGHQFRNSGVSNIQSNSDTPDNGLFITQYNWQNPINNNLWQGVNGINNVCPKGFRVPTAAEWTEEKSSWISQDSKGAFLSPLKLTTAGYRDINNNGEIVNVGKIGGYWTSTTSGNLSLNLDFSNSSSVFYINSRSLGMSVRCIKE